jgi:hypothetical protein
VKNGGSHFLTEIASREFMDNLTSLLQAVGPVAVNAEVKSKILELIQSWAGATEGRYELSYIGEVYKRLQREGYQFPPRVTVASSMIDSSAVRCSTTPYPRPWVWFLEDSRLMRCQIASRMDRFGCLYAMSNGVYVYQSETPLPKLRQLLRPAVFKQITSTASPRNTCSCASR